MINYLLGAIIGVLMILTFYIRGIYQVFKHGIYFIDGGEEDER